ncbi:MAG: tetratricopeptide repeat protein, partial [Tepidisphaerales bacterium]
MKAAAIADPVVLRDRLFAVANADDKATLLAWCTANRAAIVQHFPEWTNAKAYANFDPKDPRQIQYIMNGLGATAEMFRDLLGEPALWEGLAGPPDESPFTRFQEIFKKARTLAEGMQYEAAVDLLTAYLIDIKSLAGSGADEFRAYAHGLIGMSLYQANRAADALGHLQQALNLCTAMNDREGIDVYLSNLYNAHRYLGQPAEAGGYAEKLADLHRGTPKENAWRQRAARTREGEPLLRMIVRQGEQTVELDEITALKGQASFIFQRNREPLQRCQALLNAGKKAGSQGKFEEALALFRDAARADPYDPDPHYQSGLALLHLQRYPQAVEEYETTARLAPGWFNVGSDLWIAQELLAGRLAHEDFLAQWILEDGGMD